MYVLAPVSFGYRNGVSRIAGYSNQSLITKFKQQYGATPIDYVTEIRVNKAKELLIHTCSPIGHIAKQCGYDNVYYFSNLFKKQTGMSFLKFRQLSVL